MELAYLPPTPLVCVEPPSRTTTNNLSSATSVPNLRHQYRQKPLSSSTKWGILGPAARVLKGSANVVNNSLLSLRDGLSEEERMARARKEEQRQILSLRMKNAETMEQWKSAARDLDVLEDNEAWKADNHDCKELDAPLIETRLRQLDEARINCDVKAMLNLVRTALSRDLGGMGDIRLYKHSHIGTKNLIERYVSSTVETIHSLVEISKHTLPQDVESKDIMGQVVYARQAFGRSALLLSGGATFGMNHIGVLKALYEAKLLPRIISGASAGSIVCAVVCTRTDEEIPKVLDEFPYGDLAVFEEADREDTILERVHRLLTEGSWIDIKHLTRVMRELLGDITFQEAYNRTRRILNICVSSASVYELPRLLNYITSPNVMIWSAVAASCSVPFVFSAAQLLVKNPITGENTPWNPTPQKWIDGSVDGDIPMTRLAEMFNVNHFIVSQVNPHVVPFLVKDEDAIAQDASSDKGPGWVYSLTHLARDEVLHRMHVLTELGVFPNLVTKARSILSQKYSGDITILPQIELKDFPRILKNPTAEFMVQACLSGERATWPKLSRIRNHCAVELALDAAVQELRARVVFSQSQVDLRRMSTNTNSNDSGYKRHPTKRRGSAQPIHSLHSSIPSQEEEEEDAEPLFRDGLGGSRPPLRTASTYWNINRQRMGMAPVTPKPQHKTTQNTPLPTPPSEGVERFEEGRAGYFARRIDFRIPDPAALISQLSSEEDRDRESDERDGHKNSDEEHGHEGEEDDDDEADADEEDSSPEFDGGLDGPSDAIGLGLEYKSPAQQKNGEIDFFSSSQPVTSGTDRVLATSPAWGRGGLGAGAGGKRANIGLVMKAIGKGEVSTVEKKYKKIFHGQGEEV